MIRSVTIALSSICLLSVCNALASPIKRVMVVGGTHGNEYTGTNARRMFLDKDTA